MKKMLLLAALAAATMTPLAKAADVAPPRVVQGYVEPLVRTHNWTGPYLGLMAGGAALNSGATFTNPALGSFGVDTGDTGWLLGIQGGYDYQIGIVTLGANASYAWTKLSGSGTVPPSISGADVIHHSSVDSIATAGGKLGLVFGERFRPFVEGGWAGGSVGQSGNASAFGITLASWDTGGWRNGWYWGVGIDVALTRNWFAGLTYRHIDLRDSSVTLPGTATTVTAHNNIDIAKLSFNYRFGG